MERGKEENEYLPLLFSNSQYSSSELLKDENTLRGRNSLSSRKSSMIHVKAVTRLETLSAGGTNAILILTYVVFSAAVLFSYLQGKGYLSEQILLSGAPCSHQPVLWNESCTRIEKNPDRIFWAADIHNFTRFSRGLSVDLLIGNLSDSSNLHPKYHMLIDFQFLGIDKTLNFQETTLIEKENISIWVYCNTTTCDPVNLVQTNQEMGSWDFSDYVPIIKYRGNVYPNQIGQDVHYVVSSIKSSIHMSELIVRCTFVILTVVFLIGWFKVLFCRYGSFSCWLPERKWLTFLLVSLFLWQNPVFAIAQWYNQVSPTTHFIANCCQAIAESCLYVVWLLMMDGLKDRLHTLKLFYLPKLVFGAVIFLFTLAGELLLLSLPNHNQLLVFKEMYVLVRMISIFLVFFWIFWMFFLILRTGKALRQLSYLSTRFQQLSYRIFVIQTVLVFVFLIVYYVIQLNQLFHFMKMDDFPTNLNSMVDILSEMHTSNQSIGVFVFLSVYIYLVVFIYLPPSLSVSSLSVGNSSTHQVYSSNAYILHEHQNNSSSRGYFSKPFFCLETANWLVELAWQAYYDAPGQPSACGYGELSLDLYGFELVTLLKEEILDTYVLVVKDTNRLVISFRGSASKANWITNLRAHQETLWIRSKKKENLWKGCLSRIPLAKLALPRVHSGFWRAYESIREDLQEVVSLVLDDHPSMKVYVTGHSMGGALAVFAAYDISVNLDLQVTMYNFGGPRCGNAAFVRNYNSVVPNSFRVCVDGDIVTGIPRLWGMYKHVGIEVIIDGEDGVGNLIVDPSFVERKFHAASKRRLNAHPSRVYRDSLARCLESALTYGLSRQSSTNYDSSPNDLGPFPYDL